jgi:drug/metabolite transporter (DMT)-like permease
MTVNPIAAGLLAGLLLDEPVGPNLAIGVAAVLAGLWLATTESRASAAST